MGFVYVARNRSIPGLVKIGSTDKSVGDRMRGLNGPGVPGKHESVYNCRVHQAKRLEKLTHAALVGARDSKDREFFRITAAHARRTIRATAASVGMEIVEEESDQGLDFEDRAAVCEKVAALEAENFRLLMLPQSWNPFLRGRTVEVNRRRQALMDQIARLREKLDEFRDE
jgi:hypothetical protein